MTANEMQETLRTGFNKHGRHVSESMRIKYLAELTPLRPELTRTEYRGFSITGRDHYFVDGLPHMIFTSVRKAEEAIDRCLALRSELAEEEAL